MRKSQSFAHSWENNFPNYAQKKGLLLKDRPGGGFRHAARPISAVARAALGQRKRALPWPRVQRSLAQRPPARVPAPPCPPFGCLRSIRPGIGRAVAIAGNVAGVPAPLRPLVTKRREGRGRRRGLVPRSTARGVPAASRPAMGPAPMPLWGKRRPQRRGPPAAAPPPLPPWALVRALPRRPSRPSQELARLRACDNCRPLRLHAIAPTGSYLSTARLAPSGRHLLPPV